MRRIILRVRRDKKVVGFYPESPAPYMTIASDNGLMAVEDFCKLSYPSRREREAYLAAKEEKFIEEKTLHFDRMFAGPWADDM